MKKTMIKNQLEELNATKISIEVVECKDDGFESFRIDVTGNFDDVLTVARWENEEYKSVTKQFVEHQAYLLKRYLSSQFIVSERIESYMI